MSPRDSASGLEILQLLLDVPQESLRPHKSELLAAVQKLQSSIDDQSTAPGAASCPDAQALTTDDLHQSSSSISQWYPRNSLEPAEAVSLASVDALGPHSDQRSPHAHNSSQQPHLNAPPASPLPSSIESILTRLIKTLERIEKFLSLNSDEAVKDNPPWVADDPRITDIEIAGGSKPYSTKFRRGLSQRSLAIEFDDWERSTFRTSRIHERAANPFVEPSRKLGNIQSFLDANLHRFKNLTAARDGIEHGMKLLVCERLLGGIGFSAVLIFQYDGLRSVRYPELNDLKIAIEKEESIMNLARLKADWLGDCQSKYNTWYSNFSRSSNKRHLLHTSCNQQKRLKAREPYRTNQVNPSQGTHGSILSQYVRVDGQPEALENDVPIRGVSFDAEAPSLRSGDGRTCDTIPSVLAHSDTRECTPLPWTSGRTQPSLPQAPHGAMHNELQSLENCHPRSQPQVNYDLADLAYYGPAQSDDGGLTSTEPLQQAQVNYDLAVLAYSGPAQSDDGGLTSTEPLQQAQVNYDLAVLAYSGPAQSDDGGLTSTEPLQHAQVNYDLAVLAYGGPAQPDDGGLTCNLAGAPNCGYLNRQAPANLVNNQIPMPT